MDKAKSILSKLKNKSKQTGNSLQLHIQLFCQEEFLRRLSISKYKEDFVLKGGLFIYLVTEFDSRPTIDMDFLLRNQSNSMNHILDMVEEILSVETDNGFIKFEILKIEPISVEKKYSGISIHMIGKVGNTKTPINIDFGVGDIIVPNSEIRLIKTQLEDFEQVKINTYSLESTIAEKFDAILQRFELTSRMKDFYDIWYLASCFEFDGDTLATAIEKTIKNRGTEYQKDSFERIIRLKDNEIILARWGVFVEKNKLPVEFGKIIEVIDIFIRDVADSKLDHEQFKKRWNPDELLWK